MVDTITYLWIISVSGLILMTLIIWKLFSMDKSESARKREIKLREKEYNRKEREFKRLEQEAIDNGLLQAKTWSLMKRANCPKCNSAGEILGNGVAGEKIRCRSQCGMEGHFDGQNLVWNGFNNSFIEDYL